MVLTVGAVSSDPYTVDVAFTQPGLLAPSAFVIGGRQYVAALFPDGVTYALPPGSIPGVSSRRAQPGDTLTLYGIGFGPVTPSIPAGQIVQQNNSLALPLYLVFGQIAAIKVPYQGLAPNAIGLYQFNVVVPNVLSTDSLPFVYMVGGVSGSQKLNIAVENGSLPQVQSISLDNSAITGGGQVKGTVTLSSPAFLPSAVLSLSSNNSSVTVPATVIIPGNSSTGSFSITTAAVSNSQTAIITATYNGSSAKASLVLNPDPNIKTFPNFQLDLTLNPAGYSSGSLGTFTVKPENGLSTFTIGTIAFSFIHCVASNAGQTFTCDTLGQGTNLFVFPTVPSGYLTSGSMIVNLAAPTISNSGGIFGPVNGSLSVMIDAPGTPTQSLFAPLTGTYRKF